MASYCTLADLKTYANITASTDDALLQVMLDAATARIDSKTARTFQAASDTTKTFDLHLDVCENELIFGEDISYITSVINGDGEDVTTQLYHNPRNLTPYYSVGFKTSSANAWTFSTNIQDAISVTGRWAYMKLENITALSRSTNVVTATVNAPKLSVGMTVFVLGVADSSFNGTFVVTSNTGSAITWAQTAANDTDTTGVLLYTPVDIVTACRRLAAWMYRQKDTQQGDTDRPLLAGDGTVIMPTTLPQDVEMILYPYMKRSY